VLEMALGYDECLSVVTRSGLTSVTSIVPRKKPFAADISLVLLRVYCAIELYTEIFENEGKLDKLEGFMSHHGADFYGLPRNSGKITLIKEAWQLPKTLKFGKSTLIPFRPGGECLWKIESEHSQK
jgi:dihydroorotase